MFLGKRYLDWDLPDPAGKPVEQVRSIVEDIDRRAQALVSLLLGNRRAVAGFPLSTAQGDPSNLGA